MDFEKARFNMVEQQVRPWDVLDERVLYVIGHVPRENFVPEQYRNLAYSDTRIPMAHGHHMLNPNVAGRILQHLDIREDDLILEIGTGSGYLTACLANLGRHVDSVEIDENAADEARERLEALGLINFTISVGDAAHGWEQKRNYDAIVMTGSMHKVPNEYLQLLAIGGRLFAVTGDEPVMTAQLITRTGKKSWETEDLFETCIERLDGHEHDPAKEFHF